MNQQKGMVKDMAQSYNPGDVVYVMYRNPHIQDVVNVQEAAIVENPDEAGELCLFLYETYYPLNEEFAVYGSEREAIAAYEDYFGPVEEEGFHG